MKALDSSDAMATLESMFPCHVRRRMTMRISRLMPSIMPGVLIDGLLKTNATLDWVTSRICWIAISTAPLSRVPNWLWGHQALRVSSTNPGNMAESVSSTGLVTAAERLHFISERPQLCPGPLLTNEGVFLGHKQAHSMYLLRRFRSGMVSAAWRLAWASQILRLRLNHLLVLTPNVNPFQG